MMNEHITFMQRCLQLAEMGRYTCAPNPMVGSVLVHENRIIAEGWHHKAGESHAERKAILQVDDENILKQSTLYVSLEPCSHFGRTPPCASLIVEKMIPKVVVASLDSNPLVAGKGLELLKSNGIEVVQGILEKEAQELNKKFYTFHEKKRPYILLKWAQTADGFIGKTENGIAKSLAISNDFSNRKVHMLRAEYDAILVGSNTAFIDNPKLDVRHVAGKNPLRIVLDRNLKIPSAHHLLSDGKPTWVLNRHMSVSDGAVSYKKHDMNHWDELEIWVREMYNSKIQSLIVEGGSEVLQAFLDKNLWDEAIIIKNSSMQIHQGAEAPKIHNTFRVSSTNILDNEWVNFRKF